MKPQTEMIGKIGGPGTGPRKTAKVRCVSPTGVEEWHTPSTAHDLSVIHGWQVFYKETRTEPRVVAEAAKPEVDESIEETTTDTEVEIVKALTPEQQELKDLRDKAAALGISVPGTWGKKKLREAIEAAEAN